MSMVAARAVRSNAVAAIPILHVDGKPEALGPLTQLPRAAKVEICGDGFNEQTIKVRFGGLQYFVFRADIEEMR